MRSEIGDKWTPFREFSNDEVMKPDFHLADAVSGGSVVGKNLFLQTFEQSPTNNLMWHSHPPSEWRLLASIYPAQIVMHPVHANPHAQRYLSSKNGRFKTLIYQDNAAEQLPETVEEATSQIDGRLAWGLFNTGCEYGLGLHKDIEAVWRGLQLLPDVDTLKISREGPTSISGKVVSVKVTDLDQFRRTFAKVHRKGRERIKDSKAAIVRNDLLTALNPERFQKYVYEGAPEQLVKIHLVGSRQEIAASRAARKSSVRLVRDQLATLASEAPRDLMELHSEIERVTLTKMIERFESMLQQSLSEGQWQRFFEDNIFILTLVFARPVRLLHTQFHAQVSGLDGSGAQVGDFLFAEQGQALAIVEIKKPSSPLMLNTPYRNDEVYGPNAELSGAITQVLYQQSALQSYWLLHARKPELTASHPDAIKCVVIAGTTPADEAKRRSFEIFRNACKNVEVITFNELLGKLQLLLNHLTPRPPELAGTVPF